MGGYASRPAHAGPSGSSTPRDGRRAALGLGAAGAEALTGDGRRPAHPCHHPGSRHARRRHDLGWSARGRSARPPDRRRDGSAAASPITVPVVRRTLAAKVIVRGTVRYGDPQTAVLATSKLKQGSAATSSPVRPAGAPSSVPAESR